ncbi:MAG: hypothetical protein RL226_2371 [Bacteroidota bacterium]
MVGMHAVSNAMKRGVKVRVLLREAADKTALLQHLQYEQIEGEPEWCIGDILDVSSLEDAMAGCEEVFHAAALVSFHGRDRDALMTVNVEGTANMVNVALSGEVRTFYYISSVAALGRGEKEQLTDEETEWKDGPTISGYARSKHLAEREVWRGHEEGLRVVVVNPGVILGYGDFNRSSAALYSNIYKGLPFYPSGTNGFVAVADVVHACFYLAEKKLFNDRFLLVGEHWTYKQLFESIAQSIGVQPPQKSAPTWLLQVTWRIAALMEFMTGKRAVITKEAVNNTRRSYTYSNRKMVQTGFTFTPLADVIAQAGKAYKESITP